MTSEPSTDQAITLANTDPKLLEMRIFSLEQAVNLHANTSAAEPSGLVLPRVVTETAAGFLDYLVDG